MCLDWPLPELIDQARYFNTLFRPAVTRMRNDSCKNIFQTGDTDIGHDNDADTQFLWVLTKYLLLSVTFHTNFTAARCLINVIYLTACCLYQVMMTLHFLNDVAYDAESTQKTKITS